MDSYLDDSRQLSTVFNLKVKLQLRYSDDVNQSHFNFRIHITIIHDISEVRGFASGLC
jgi:hypothetical protein